MQTKDEARLRILELCSETAYGSWMFWSTENKTEKELESILVAITDLVKEKKLEVLEHRFGGPYEKASFDVGRLRNELKKSTISDVDADTFYWFLATEEGEKEYKVWAKEYWTEERIAEEKQKWKK
jgi:hypothetical protein